MFHAADLLIINKIDLLPYVEFDVGKAIECARRVRPGLDALCVSAKSGEHFSEWLDWLECGARRSRAQRDGTVAALRRRVAALESELAHRKTPA
jgi:hydrogenase nickel incorporation protein HypB